MVRAFLLYKPAKPLNVMVGWCVNDYQIDIATPEGRAEYKRILDTAAELGAEHVLFAPANSDARAARGQPRRLEVGVRAVARPRPEDPAERMGAATGAIPASVREMLDYAAAKQIKLARLRVSGARVRAESGMAGLARRDSKRQGRQPRGPQPAGLADRDARRASTSAPGIGGYAFDHTFLDLEGASRYAQWWGWRRVMEELRRDVPDIVIDGRQAYHLYGPWSWLAGSYPHPTFNDEQPESFVRSPTCSSTACRPTASASPPTAIATTNSRRARWCPASSPTRRRATTTPASMPSGEDRPRRDAAAASAQRDWDYLGWRYSLLSSIAVAGWNNVLDMIPARDPEEFKHFSDADRRGSGTGSTGPTRTRTTCGTRADSRTAGHRQGGRDGRDRRRPRVSSSCSTRTAGGWTPTRSDEDRSGSAERGQVHPARSCIRWRSAPIGKPGAGVWRTATRSSRRDGRRVGAGAGDRAG